MIPPLSATPSAPTMTRSTLSMMYLHGPTNASCVGGLGAQQPACGQWSSLSHPAAESRMTLEGILALSSHCCITFLQREYPPLTWQSQLFSQLKTLWRASVWCGLIANLNQILVYRYIVYTLLHSEQCLLSCRHYPEHRWRVHILYSTCQWKYVWVTWWQVKVVSAANALNALTQSHHWHTYTNWKASHYWGVVYLEKHTVLSCYTSRQPTNLPWIINGRGGDEDFEPLPTFGSFLEQFQDYTGSRVTQNGLGRGGGGAAASPTQHHQAHVEPIQLLTVPSLMKGLPTLAILVLEDATLSRYIFPIVWGTVLTVRR